VHILLPVIISAAPAVFGFSGVLARKRHWNKKVVMQVPKQYQGFAIQSVPYLGNSGQGIPVGLMG
jgi:hypothetical protein